jgi:hypothetical protein
MIRVTKHPLASLAALSMLVLAPLAGCESEGPAEKAGKDIDAGIQKAKDAVNPPGPAEKAGRALDKAAGQ